MSPEIINAVEVDHLTKKFGDLVAVNDVSFNVAQREIFGLLGPNGAGKTTLIRMMTTLTPPTSGTARIAGHDIVTDEDGVRHAMGVIPQALTSDPELTATENMLIHAKLYGVPRTQRDKRSLRFLVGMMMLTLSSESSWYWTARKERPGVDTTSASIRHRRR